MLPTPRERALPRSKLGSLFAAATAASKGIELIRRTVADHGRVGSEIARLHFLGLLAEALLKDEQTEEGLTVLSEALSVVHRIGGHYFVAELYRLKGELLLKVENGRSRSEDRRSRIEDRDPRSSILNPFLHRKNAFIRPSKLPGGRARDLWSYEP